MECYRKSGIQKKKGRGWHWLAVPPRWQAKTANQCHRHIYSQGAKISPKNPYPHCTSEQAKRGSEQGKRLNRIVRFVVKKLVGAVLWGWLQEAFGQCELLTHLL